MAHMDVKPPSDNPKFNTMIMTNLTGEKKSAISGNSFSPRVLHAASFWGKTLGFPDRISTFGTLMRECQEHGGPARISGFRVI